MKNVSTLGVFALALVCAASLALSSPAFAAVADTGTRVSFPVGEWIDNGVGVVFGAIAAAAAVAFRALPAHIRWALTFVKADENLGKALAYARAELKKKYGKLTWNVDLRSEAVALALRYGRDHFPKMIEQQFGGLERTREKLAARLEEWIEKAVEKLT